MTVDDWLPPINLSIQRKETKMWGASGAKAWGAGVWGEEQGANCHRMSRNVRKRKKNYENLNNVKNV